MRAGGTLVILNGYNSTSSEANAWLEPYGLRFHYTGPRFGAIMDHEPRRWATMLP